MDVETEEDDLRAVVERAMDAASSEPDPSPEPTPAEPTPEPTEKPEGEPEPKEEPAGDGPSRDERGRFASKGEKHPKPPPVPQPPPGQLVPPGIPQPPPPQPQPIAPRAPQSWKPIAREKWTALPPEVQQEVVRREREAAVAIQQSAERERQHAEASKGWSEFRNAVAPFPMFHQNPIGTARDLFQTAAGLQAGPPQQKARIVAEIVRQFGVDIGLLDSALAGPQPGPSGYQAAPQQPYRDPRVDQLFQRIESAEQQRTQSLHQKANEQIEALAANSEFFDDVREDMADLLEVAAKRGIALSPEEAYKRACLLNPDVSPVYQQREAAKLASNAQASTQRAKAAASSVKSNPAGAPAAPQSEDLRSIVERAYDNSLGK